MSALLTDRFQLAMMQACLEEGLTEPAVFELFVRSMPPQRNYLVAAGLEQVLQFLQSLSFSEAEFAWLRDVGGCSEKMLAYVSKLRFTGDVDAMPEGTPFFAHEPVLRVTAPLPLAQLVESRLLNLIHLETLLASKAARMVTAAGPRRLLDFGLRHAQGAEAGLLTARVAYLVGFAGTATAEAGRRFGVPVATTMAHSYVEAHDDESAAFLAFARAHPDQPTLLIDTYDTAAAAAKLIELVRSPDHAGPALGGVRIDSGDLVAHAITVRRLLNEAHLPHVQILVSGQLDEHRIAALLQAGAPIDGFGVGACLGAAQDVPLLDTVYQLQQYAGLPRRKRSEDRNTWPGVKQVYRRLGPDGRIERDLIALADEPSDQQGEALLQPYLRGGRRVMKPTTLEESRAYHARQTAQLPDALRSLQPAQTPFAATISPKLRAFSRAVAATQA